MEGLSAFAATFVLVGLLELGDKTQLLLISLATKHRPLPIIAGAALGETAVTAIGVGVGAAIVAVVPVVALKLASGALFIGIGLWNLLAKEKEATAESEGRVARNPFLATLGLAFLAELGDKTMLAVIALSGSLAAPVSVFAGASLALLTIAVVSVALGRVLKRYITARWLRVVSATLFIGAGVLTIVEAVWPG
ncbi:MAG: hypothetical protein A3K65_06375 [Euryarchaeota archaeon RBG_16_68_12]|nr:MAG: hypothetical protein A3K65_06375 [Euryarchaeota archaeon RBG_16_68_12]